MAIKDGLRAILVVEDDESVRESIKGLLGAAGFNAKVYASAESLLADGTSEDTLCVISDLNLPAMSGLDLLTELRRMGSGTPVIIITAFDSASNRQTALDRGAAAYLPKPFPRHALLSAINAIPDPSIRSRAH
jgi:DNA-binding response OmpR family regulator